MSPTLRRVTFFAHLGVLIAAGLGSSPGCTTIIYRDRPGTGVDLANMPRQGWLTVEHVTGAETPNHDPVVQVGVRVDGVEVGGCELAYVEDDVCFADVPLTPGSHQLEVRARCRGADGHTLNCLQIVDASFQVAPGVTARFDVRELLREPRQRDRFLTHDRTSAQEPSGECEAALAALASAASCTADDLDRALELARNAQARCPADELQESSSLVLLALAGRSYFLLSPSQCIPARLLQRRIPGIMLHPGGEPDRWPAGTLDPSASSWSWSRDGVSRRVIDERRGERLLAAIVEGLQRIRPRVALFQEVLYAVVDPSRRPALMEHITRERFSLDPRTIEGHRAYLAIVFWWVSPALSDFVGRGVRDDASLHCGRLGVATEVARFMTHDDTITEAEWAGITAMVERTPSEGRLRWCDYVFRGPGYAGVPHDVRLSWLARFDCSERRSANVRGGQLEPHLRDVMRGRGYDAILFRLRGEFASCIRVSARERWTP